MENVHLVNIENVKNVEVVNIINTLCKCHKVRNCLTKGVTGNVVDVKYIVNGLPVINIGTVENFKDINAAVMYRECHIRTPSVVL